MTRDVAVVHPESSLLDAVKLMAQRRISGIQWWPLSVESSV
jgi:hypothetical protein